MKIIFRVQLLTENTNHLGYYVNITKFKSAGAVLVSTITSSNVLSIIHRCLYWLLKVILVSYQLYSSHKCKTEFSTEVCTQVQNSVENWFISISKYSSVSNRFYMSTVQFYDSTF